jgi:hypothetical protein
MTGAIAPSRGDWIVFSIARTACIPGNVFDKNHPAKATDGILRTDAV